MKRRAPPPITGAALPPITYAIPASLQEMLNVGGSFAGFSGVSGWLACPERVRLEKIGVKRKGWADTYSGLVQLDALGFGTLMHCLSAIRLVHGMKVALDFIGPVSVDVINPFVTQEVPAGGIGLCIEDRLRAFELLTLYDQTWPVGEADIYEYFGVELEVAVELAPGVIRTVRYDKVVRDRRDGRIFSLELKTTSSSGESAMQSYFPQFATQVAIWNRSPLGQSVGRMVGVVPDTMVKTKSPKCERLFPRTISRFMEERIIEYLKLPDQIQMPMNADGSYPRFFHSCWSRWGACAFTSLCWEGAVGDFEVAAP